MEVDLDSAYYTISEQDSVIKQKNQRINRLLRDKSMLTSKFALLKQQVLRHWQQDGHRDVCQALRNVHPSARERSFLLCIIHGDYLAKRAHICAKQVAFMRAHPGTEFHTTFNYDTVPAGVRVLPLLSPGQHNIPGEAAHAYAEWDDCTARARRSRRRMELHVVHTAKGRAHRARIVPLRSSSAAVYDGLRQTTNALPADADLDAGSMRGGLSLAPARLYLETEDVVQVHCD
ncbi:hypothetical protein DFH09DRAFT_1309489 [Mycena vulgaris]|nr:hypothetical protein DFH09DRAFT_1309489 [Mycena vulgaris]